MPEAKKKSASVLAKAAPAKARPSLKPATGVAAAAAAPLVPPSIEVELLKGDYSVLCTSLAKVPGGFSITGVARPSTYRNLGSICAEGDSGVLPLFFAKEEARSTATLTVFKVLVPNAILKSPQRFLAVEKAGGQRTCLTAGKKAKLPPKWIFSGYHLELEYQPALQQKAKLQDRCFLRSLDLQEELFKVDLSIFLQDSLSQEGPPAELQLLSEDGETVFTTPLSVTIAKKAFRVPASLHKHFTSVEIVHAEASIPVLTTFDETAMYDLVIMLGGRCLPVFPYNRYYFAKPASLIVNTGDHLHVIRHFPDPRSSAIRIAYQ